MDKLRKSLDQGNVELNKLKKKLLDERPENCSSVFKEKLHEISSPCIFDRVKLLRSNIVTVKQNKKT